jgi:hypothetical protein
MSILIAILTLVFSFGFFWFLASFFPAFKKSRPLATRVATGSFVLLVVSSFIFTTSNSVPALNQQVKKPVKLTTQQQYDRAQAEKRIKAQEQYDRDQAIKQVKANAKAILEAEPSPVSAELTVQRSDDNYGVEPYFILKNSNGEEVGSTGKAHIVLTVKDYGNDTENTVYDQTIDVTYGAFSVGTRGIGAFKRDATFFRLGKIGTEKLSNENGNAYLTFTSHRGEIVKAKEFVSYP